MGDFLLDGPRTGQVVFWQFEGENGQVKFYDLDTGAILNAPPGINAPKSEAYVSASGDYLLFGRGPKGEDFVRQVLLYRFNTGKLTTVASATQAFMTADQVNGDYLVYTRKFDVYRHRISTGATIRMPDAPDGRSNYYGSVLTDGTVFYVQGNARLCGKNTKIVRFRGGKVTSVASVPDGIEIGHLNARKIDGDTHVVFRLVTCSTEEAGIYEIVL